MDRFEQLKDFIYRNFNKNQEYTWEEIIEAYWKNNNTLEKETIRRYLMGLTINHKSRKWNLPSPETNDNVFFQTGRNTIRLLNENDKLDIIENNGKNMKIDKSSGMLLDIPDPSSLEIEKTLNEWKTLENYVFQESALNKLFIKTYPKNDNMDDILIKVCSLNVFYSTKIYDVYSISLHIKKLNIDDRLSKGDLKLINDISLGHGIKSSSNKEKQLYSFATKYCSHHIPDVYPIFDSKVEKILKYFNKIHNYYNNDINIRDYSIFYNMIKSFQNHFKLENFSLKEIDRYLWLVGKDKFKKKYRNGNKNNY